MSQKHLQNSAAHFSVAPMLDWTDRHCRKFHRLISQHAWLYSEMVTTGAIIYGKDNQRFLGRDESDIPVVLQLGGSVPAEMAQCAKLGQEWGYSEININVGCPSDRVQNNQIGACLMASPHMVADCVKAMKDVVDIPVTVKCRIGIDEQDEERSIREMMDQLCEAQTDGVIIHARKAWLEGLSPKENRHVPPLNYDLVRAVKQEYSQMPIAINGGLTSIEQGLDVIKSAAPNTLDGFMMGRSIYEQPYLLSKVDALVYGDTHEVLTRDAIVEAMLPYIDNHLHNGGKLIQITRHMLGLFHGLPGGRMWRRYLSQEAFKSDASTQTVVQALNIVNTEIERMEQVALERQQMK